MDAELTTRMGQRMRGMNFFIVFEQSSEERAGRRAWYLADQNLITHNFIVIKTLANDRSNIRISRNRLL
ncbi:MAG TPA: hypothetical protein DEF45_20440 [Rhodopirellula sp.]|nr:hypothetical protein [Rhodopirellula sp.]